MTKHAPIIVAESKTTKRKVWADSEKRDAMGAVSEAPPKPEDFKHPLIAVMAHLDPFEWNWR
jgi:hypothetical protein